MLRIFGYSRVRLLASAIIFALAASGGIAVAGSQSATASVPAPVDDARLLAADKDNADWLTHGRTYDEQRFSPLNKINEKTVNRLGLAWYHNLNTHRGVEATPLVVDGVLYNTSAWNITMALDARTGKLLWTYDPEVPTMFSRLACCDIVSRGAAFYKGKLYIATLDGRLIALDAKTGQPVWTVQTFEQGDGYTITGAPRVFDGKVLIGNAGAEYGVRGYATAYDAETGKQVWRFYMVPGDPSKPFENKILEMAAKTWTGEWWKVGGGGTPWDSIVYDPELKLVYIGGGNGGPWPQKLRSPGGGDNLFLASIVAVKVDTGEYVWHYQETPGDEWDYTATQPMILADLKIDGQLRKVLMQAPKNGFFYVLDRITGKLISANAYHPDIKWATGIDIATGRPNFTPEAHYTEKSTFLAPGGYGAHNWMPMSYSPITGLVYFPVSQNYMAYGAKENWTFVRGSIGNAGGGSSSTPEERKQLQEEAIKKERNWLSAWDPVAQKEKWRVMLPASGNGGTLVTAGNLVFEGNIGKFFTAYRADTGEKLWEMPVQQTPIAGPITYMLDGEQYIAVNAGLGGGRAHAEAQAGRAPDVSDARLLVFKLGGKARLPPFAPAAALPPPPPRPNVPEALITQGEELYGQYCVGCHGNRARGGIKDLRFMNAETRDHFNDIVLKGIKAKDGMASFGDFINAEQAERIKYYLMARADEDWGKGN